MQVVSPWPGLSRARAAYRNVVPRSVRESRFARAAKALLSRAFPHDAIYDEQYYSDLIDPTAVASSGVIARSIVTDLKPGSVFDVGCGTGALLDALSGLGCRVGGLEYSQAALAYCQDRGLDVIRFDLEDDDPAKLGFNVWDVVTSLEVAEHLPASVAGRFVDLLTSLGNTVVFTAAPPGQGGTDHVNEQPPEYWIRKFAAKSFLHDDGLADRWRTEWEASASVPPWYSGNLMVFRLQTAQHQP